MIRKNAQLSVKRSQLVIKQEDIFTVPLQDIASILIEAPGVTLTASLLSECADKKVSLFTCNAQKLPNGIWTGFQQHSRQLAVLETQLALSKPFKKRLWQRIIKQKIINQAKCLDMMGKDGGDELRRLAKEVESGDMSNREAVAAKLYFRSLFGVTFTRRSIDPINRLLNYGYAIIRGLVARSLTNYGLIPCLGLYHDNQLNAFNLADDFMEVLRPVVDYHVAEQEDIEKWDAETRAGLVNLVNATILISGENHSITAAVDEMVKSFVSSCRQQDYSYLKLPDLLPVRMHKYE
ncbi:type II CRISPR-associated endonuclease Cas1 [Oceanobacillus bengalensis]|uniref:CRISPR-associated endonuclease Cas1 n=2 Tax=Oceanobacillus bengalensis TaxID=1435466 RepID=A0A494YSX4_9BACI|nr:type II CRISPR-associated endonuclease Cas1 [Oceanobacillus bengalensis]